MLGVGLKYALKKISCPVVMPPNTPPALFVKNFI